ncbi:hypothetical protein A0J61_09759 [Choanephora cucurbitarum]|uniref:Uncharacterized protein n=1 Tax=Choanephora cucurbitarum TaxID=101091 RepID=A0A1C7MZJ7_9FUNG|nr:hypothetical protein A0J61_09759 [Choanephora cucurbitarum]
MTYSIGVNCWIHPRKAKKKKQSKTKIKAAAAQALAPTSLSEEPYKHISKITNAFVLIVTISIAKAKMIYPFSGPN